MSFRIRSATEADLERIIDINFAAFAASPVMHRICPPTSPQARPFWRKHLGHELALPSARPLVVVDDAHVTSPDTAIAFAIWIAPQPPDTSLPAAEPRDYWPTDGDQDAAASFFADMAKHHRRYMGGTSHWYLSLIATDPPHQGCGAATMLLRWAETQADDARLPCYLDASPAGRPIYASPSHGFSMLEHLVYFGGIYDHVIMRREPRRGTDENILTGV